MQQIAQVLKSNGTDGELVMSFREIAPEDINLQEPVFIFFDGLPVPFYIESFTRRGNSKALVRLTDISSHEDVEEIAGKAVYVEDSHIPQMTLEEDGYAALVGWVLLAPMEDFSTSLRSGRNDSEVGSSQNDTEVCSGRNDSEVGSSQNDTEVGSDEIDSDEEMELYEVGEITDFIDIPNNPCIEVETENGAVMIPLHEDLILSVDPENQEIIMDIPDGLI